MPDRTHYQPGDRHRGYPLGGGGLKPEPPTVSLHPAAHEAEHLCVDGRHYLDGDCTAAMRGQIRPDPYVTALERCVKAAETAVCTAPGCTCHSAWNAALADLEEIRDA